MYFGSKYKSCWVFLSQILWFYLFLLFIYSLFFYSGNIFFDILYESYFASVNL